MKLEQMLALKQLGLSSKASVQEVKRAYAERIKDCNPETDAESWMQLHNAYMLALAALKDGAQTPVDISPLEPPPLPPEEEETGSEFDELYDKIDELAEDAGRREAQYRQRQETALRAIRAEEEAQRQKLEAERRAREKAEHEQIAKRVKLSVARLRRRAIWKKLDEDDISSLLRSSEFQAISKEPWCIELLYPLLLRSVYDRRLTREAQVALSLRVAELSRRDYPNCPNIFSILPQIMTNVRARAEKACTEQGRVWGWITFFLLLLLAYLPDLYVSDVEYVQNANIYASMTMQECIRSFTGENGLWYKSGGTVHVFAGSKDRSIHAEFTLDENESNANFPSPLYSKPGIVTRRVYVLEFRVGSYNCTGLDELKELGIGLSLEEKGIGAVRIPWKPSSGDAAG